MTKKKNLSFGILTLACISAFGTSTAASPAHMTVVGKANPPIGHYEVCRTYVNECTGSYTDLGPIALTEPLWKAMLEVNYTVNSSITPLTDLEIFGVEERWAYPRSVGDCEDYALLKRKMLIDRGFSPSDLLLTVVLQPNGEGHAVLTVRTDHGDFILDNMRDRVLLWSDTEYTYLKRQASDQPSRWVKLRDGRAVAVASVSSN